MKKRNQEEQLVQFSKDCADYFERWNDLYENGGQDPFWEDGVNLNLTRNHILYAQKEMTLKYKSKKDVSILINSNGHYFKIEGKTYATSRGL